MFINDRHAKRQWGRVPAKEAYEALLHCFPLFFYLISLACMHLVPLFYACPPFMNMVYYYYYYYYCYYLNMNERLNIILNVKIQTFLT